MTKKTPRMIQNILGKNPSYLDTIRIRVEVGRQYSHMG